MELTKTKQTTDDLKRIYWAANPKDFGLIDPEGYDWRIRSWSVYPDEIKLYSPYHEETITSKDLTDFKPELTPFSELSDEDAIFIGSIIDENEVWYVKYRTDHRLDVVGGDRSEHHLSIYTHAKDIIYTKLGNNGSYQDQPSFLDDYVKIIDFLRSQGYNLDFEPNEFLQL